MHRRRSSRVLSLFVAFACVLVGTVAALATPVSGASFIGAVFTQTNTTPNRVVVFDRGLNGSLTQAQSYATGGNGSPTSPPFGFPILDSQGAVILDPLGQLLFVVNGGSDTISTFRVNIDNTLQLVSHVPSGGDFPISVTAARGLLYVLNAGTNANTSGFRYSSTGQLTPIPDSTRNLAHPAVPAQIGFDTLGFTLVVSERGTDELELFTVGFDGRPSQPVVRPAIAAPEAPVPVTPFGFAFTPRNHLIVSNATGAIPGRGSVSSYNVPALSNMANPVDQEFTGAGAPCWVVTTRDGRFAFVTNTLDGTVTSLRVGTDGSLTEVGTEALSRPGLAADPALTRDNRFLYVVALDADLSGPGPVLTAARIEVFGVNLVTGDLTSLGATPSTLPAGTSGLAAK